MFKKEEIIAILASTLILGFTISLIASWNLFFSSIFAIFMVILVNVLGKKIASFYLDSEIEIKIWHFQRYGFRPHWKLNKPFPIGLFFPIILKVLTMGMLNWLATLTFDIKAKTYRTAKRHGKFAFAEMSDFHIALIAISGIVANLLFGIIGYLIGYYEFAQLNLYMAFFNILPLSDLDGNKIFFGSRMAWFILMIIAGISILFAAIL